MPLGIKPTVDFAFKKIFGSPENVQALIGLLNAILDLPNPITHVTILNPFSYQEFAAAKLIVLDIRACDSAGRGLNIEMQVSVFGGLVERLVYYACSLYVDQLESGQNYADLKPAISICLLTKELFRDSSQAHHRFQLVDRESGRELRRAIEVHMVELTKYNLSSATLSKASKIEQWAFFLLYADQYDPASLRELLGGVEFQQAITVIEAIAAKTEDHVMYDEREKAQRDYQWAIQGARDEGLEEGLEKGREEGREEGLEKGSVAGGIRLLQQLLGEAESSLEDLRELPMKELSSRLADLQKRLRSRGS